MMRRLHMMRELHDAETYIYGNYITENYMVRELYV